MSERDILVIGYPKSGNTWLSRLLGQALNSPVMGWGSALPLAKEGENRSGHFFVRQLHLRPVYARDGAEFIADEWRANIHAWNDEKVAFILRDPRDIVVSAYYYWDRQSIRETIQAMHRGVEPFNGVGDYTTFVESWRAVTEIPLSYAYYEHLLKNTEYELSYQLANMGIPQSYWGDLGEAVEAQAFDNKRAEIKDNPSSTEKRPYGMEIQLKNMRKGVAGEWKRHFNQEDRELFQELFGNMLIKLGYERSENWLKPE